jgi:glycosyltransferase involved in cell wall biosynthesis
MARPVQATVIVAVLNASAHIEEQLVALARQQTGVSWELVLADNGCTDDTLAIVDRVAPRFNVPVRVIDASTRRGLAAARNRGAAAAAGELLLFCDGDDVVDDLWVEEMVRALRQHPFVGGRLELLELNGEEVYGWRQPLWETGPPELGGAPMVAGANHGCAAAELKAVGGYSETLASGEDADLSLRMHARGVPALFAEHAVVHYRYRRSPWKAIRQSWGYGKALGAIQVLHSLEPTAFLDLIVLCQRETKHAGRLAVAGRRPVRPAVDIAWLLGQASITWREPAFWHTSFRRVQVVNPLPVQLDRLRRLAKLVRG